MLKNFFRSLSEAQAGFLVKLAGGILAVFFVCGLLSPWIAPYGLEDMDLMSRLVAPFTSLAHPLGTDTNGMDMLTRLMYGGRVSLMIGFIVVACSRACSTRCASPSSWR